MPLQLMKILDDLNASRIRIGIQSASKPEILRELLRGLLEQGIVDDLDSLLVEFLERESKGSTGIGNGIAIPHVRTDQVQQLEYLFANSNEGIDFDSLDGEPVHIVLLMMAPKDSHGKHIKALAKVSRILNDETTRLRLRRAKSPDEVLRILEEREEEVEGA